MDTRYFFAMETAGESDTRWSPLAKPLQVQDLDAMHRNLLQSEVGTGSCSRSLPG